MVREFRLIFIFFLFSEFDGVFVVCFCWFFGFFGEVWFDSLVFVDIFFCCGIMGTFSCWYMMSFIGGVLDLMFLLVYMYRFLLAELFGSETVDIFLRFWCFGWGGWCCLFGRYVVIVILFSSNVRYILEFIWECFVFCFFIFIFCFRGNLS